MEENYVTNFLLNAKEQEIEVSTDVYDLFKTPSKFQPKASRSKRTPKRKFNEEHSLSDSECDKNRPRTPSGHPYSASVGSIKFMFEQNQQEVLCSQPRKASRTNGHGDSSLTVNAGENHEFKC